MRPARPGLAEWLPLATRVLAEHRCRFVIEERQHRQAGRALLLLLKSSKADHHCRVDPANREPVGNTSGLWPAVASWRLARAIRDSRSCGRAGTALG